MFQSIAKPLTRLSTVQRTTFFSTDKGVYAVADSNVDKMRIFGILFAKILILQIESPAMNEVALGNPNFSPIHCDGSDG